MIAACLQVCGFDTRRNASRKMLELTKVEGATIRSPTAFLWAALKQPVTTGGMGSTPEVEPHGRLPAVGQTDDCVLGADRPWPPGGCRSSRLVDTPNTRSLDNHAAAKSSTSPATFLRGDAEPKRGPEFGIEIANEW